MRKKGVSPRPTAPSARFRRALRLERVATQIGRLSPGPVRQWLKRVYHAMLMVQSAGAGLRCTLPGGEVIRVLPAYRYLSWNPDEYAAFRAVVRPGTVALDVGANVGAYALLLGHWTGRSGAVFAFEPAPVAFDGLARHIRLNHLEDVVRPAQMAIGDGPGAARLLVASTAGESRLAIPTDPIHASVDVLATTIDDFCARERIDPDFIKIDVEGFELAALRGARETIRRRRGALALFVEMHPALWPVLGVQHADVLDELSVQRLEPVPIAPTADIWATDGVCLRLVQR
jgi:FkbM family methyltransferase